MDGIHRYLTTEHNGSARIFTAVLLPNFERQIWRKDQGHVANLISLGKSGRFLQADVEGQISIQPDGDEDQEAPRGFDVELVKEVNFRAGSTWTPALG